jgi:hypothetical protein
LARDDVRAGAKVTNIIDGLLARVQDQDLRAVLSREVDRLRDTKDFGLVFERDIPENVRLYSYPVKRGVTVQERARTSETTWLVRRIAAVIENDDEHLMSVDLKNPDVASRFSAATNETDIRKVFADFAGEY